MVLVLLATAVAAGGVAIHKHHKHKKARKAAALNASKPSLSPFTPTSIPQQPPPTREPVYRESADDNEFAPPNYLQYTADQKIEGLHRGVNMGHMLGGEREVVVKKEESDELPGYIVRAIGSVRVTEELERQDTGPAIQRRLSAGGQTV